MSMTPADRRVLTFYSFKGGVGRTMLLANTAYRLANRHGLRVIAVDWDLEAPGLHRFFGLSNETIAQSSGILDYFKSWHEALERRAPSPPDVTPSLIPITDPKHAPRFGSLSLLPAGRIDGSYARRLIDFNWQEFYSDSAGASAVETLRSQLIEQADVVLIDSRTGFTDAGGICTIQIPDGVVLVTAPNHQSLEGIDQIARAIAQSPPSARMGRARPRMWLVVSRVPLVEETYLAEQWFKKHTTWFNERKKADWWLTEDHPEGIQSHKIPHRGRWGFDEAVLTEAAGADSDDLLGLAHDRFAEILLRWLRGAPPMELDLNRRTEKTLDSEEDIAALEVAARGAERRGDISGMAVAMVRLAMKLQLAGNSEQAIRRAEQASGIFLSRGAKREYVEALFALAWALTDLQRHAEASETATRALQVVREIGDLPIRLHLSFILANASLAQGLHPDAERACSEAYNLSNQLPDSVLDAGILWLVANTLRAVGSSERAIELFRRSERLAHTTGNSSIEELALERLLNMSDTGEPLEDASGLRTRLTALRDARTRNS